MINDLKHYEGVMRPLSSFSSAEVAEAMRVAITYTIASAFDLSHKEIVALNSRLQSITSEVFAGSPDSVPVEVLQELNTKYYSQFLLNKRGGTFVVTPEPKRVDMIVWVDTFMEAVNSAYSLSALQSARLYNELMGVMEEVGVRDTDSRTPTYLPNSVRHNISSSTSI